MGMSTLTTSARRLATGAISANFFTASSRVKTSPFLILPKSKSRGAGGGGGGGQSGSFFTASGGFGFSSSGGGAFFSSTGSGEGSVEGSATATAGPSAERKYSIPLRVRPKTSTKAP